MTDQMLSAIGSVTSTDEKGYLQKTVSQATLQQNLLPLIEQIVSTARQVFPNILHSVYIRGSVAKGSFVPRISDIDPVIVTTVEPSDSDFAQLKTAFIKLCEQYPSVTNIEKNVQVLDKFVAARNPIYKYQTVCVFGEDLSEKMEPLRLGKETVVHLPKILASIDESIPRIQNQTESKWIKHWSIWMCKQLIRSAHELVAEELGRFARDIFPCYEGASKLYPKYEPLLKRTAEIAVFGTTDKRELLKITSEMRLFLAPEIEKFYASA